MFLINVAMEKISIGTAALIVVLGMAVVFFGLILLMCVTKIAGAIISRKKAAELLLRPLLHLLHPPRRTRLHPAPPVRSRCTTSPTRQLPCSWRLSQTRLESPSTSFASSLSARSRTNSCFYIINSRKRVYALPAFIFSHARPS